MDTASYYLIFTGSVYQSHFHVAGCRRQLLWVATPFTGYHGTRWLAMSSAQRPKPFILPLGGQMKEAEPKYDSASEVCASRSSQAGDQEGEVGVGGTGQAVMLSYCL